MGDLQDPDNVWCTEAYWLGHIGDDSPWSIYLKSVSLRYFQCPILVGASSWWVRRIPNFGTSKHRNSWVNRLKSPCFCHGFDPSLMQKVNSQDPNETVVVWLVLKSLEHDWLIYSMYNLCIYRYTYIVDKYMHIYIYMYTLIHTLYIPWVCHQNLNVWIFKSHCLSLGGVHVTSPPGARTWFSAVTVVIPMYLQYMNHIINHVNYQPWICIYIYI